MVWTRLGCGLIVLYMLTYFFSWFILCHAIFFFLLLLLLFSVLLKGIWKTKEVEPRIPLRKTARNPLWDWNFNFMFKVSKCIIRMNKQLLHHSCTVYSFCTLILNFTRKIIHCFEQVSPPSVSASRLRSPSHDNLSSVNNNTFSNHRATLEKDVSSSLLFCLISGPVGS